MVNAFDGVGDINFFQAGASFEKAVGNIVHAGSEREAAERGAILECYPSDGFHAIGYFDLFE